MKTINRRQFLRLLGFGVPGTAALLAGGAFFRSHNVQTVEESRGIPDDAADQWITSTCTFCAVGCGVQLGVRAGHIAAVRGVPDHPVNAGRLCVKGIYQHKILDVPNRARVPLVRPTRNRSGPWQTVSWKEAVERVAEHVTDTTERHGPEAIAIYYGGQMVLEDYYTIAKFGLGVVGTPHLDSNSRLCVSSPREAYQLSFGDGGTPPNYDDLEQTDCLFLVGSNLAEAHPVLFDRVVAARARRHFSILVMDPRRTRTAEIADIHLPVRAGYDLDVLAAIAGELIALGAVREDVIRAYTRGYDDLLAALTDFPSARVADTAGVSVETIRRAAREIARAPRCLMVWCGGINHGSRATRASAMFNNLCLMTGNMGRPGAGPLSLPGQGSSMSEREAGASGTFPGMRDLEDPAARSEMESLWGIPQDRFPAKGMTFTAETRDALREGRIQLLWIIGTNPASSMPDAAEFRRLLERVPTIILQEAYTDTSTAPYADILLPAALSLEKEGTWTNGERLVSRVQKAVPPPGEARPDWEIVRAVAEQMGQGHLFPYRSAREIFDEWRRVSMGTLPDMAGMDHDRILALGGIRWPCPSPDHPGTPHLYTDWRFRTPGGRANLIRPVPGGPAQPTSREFPLRLGNGRVLQAWQTGTRSRNVPELSLPVGDPFVEISPADAQVRFVEEGQEVRVQSAFGSIRARARVTDRVPPGQVFVPFHFETQPVNVCTPDVLDSLSKQPEFKGSAVEIVPL